MKKMKQYIVPVTWMVSGTVTVTAYSKTEAIEKAQSDMTPTCADNKCYVDDSWQTLDDDIEEEFDDAEDC